MSIKYDKKLGTIFSIYIKIGTEKWLRIFKYYHIEIKIFISKEFLKHKNTVLKTNYPLNQSYPKLNKKNIHKMKKFAKKS